MRPTNDIAAEDRPPARLTGALLARKGTAAPVAGSTAEITPAPANDPAIAAPPLRTVETRASAEILIVGADYLGLKLYRDLLEARGYNTAATENGLGAIEAMRMCPPDLVLVDQRPPHFVGKEVVRRIKHDPDLSGIPVVVVAEIHNEGDEAAIRADGCDGAIAKPISIPKFLRLVDELVDPD